ncbi:hypothetical protein D9M68_753180 [compost metagenome]
MPINAVSILEICARPGAEQWLEHVLWKFAERLGRLPGCVAYGVTRSTWHPRLWVFSGFWSTPTEMVRHFAAIELDRLLRMLGGCVASIRFSSFSGTNRADCS